jgi:hypothetical protein
VCDCLGYDQIVWTEPGVYVGSDELCYIYDHADDPMILHASHDDDPSLHVNVTEGTAAAAATATCDFLVTLLATSKEDCAFISVDRGSSLPISGATLSRIFQENHRNLPRTFTVARATFNEEHIRALETASSPDVEVVLASCRIPDDAGGQEVFAACLQNDVCPINLQECAIDCKVLATALTGNSRVTSLRLPSGWTVDDARKGAIFRSLAENKSLLHLELHGTSISDENLSVLCQSLQVHPTLTSLDLHNTKPLAQNSDSIALSDV